MSNKTNCRIGVRIPLKTRYELEQQCQQLKISISEFINNALKLCLSDKVVYDEDLNCFLPDNNESSSDSIQPDSKPMPVVEINDSDTTKNNYKVSWDGGKTWCDKDGNKSRSNVVIEV